MTSGIYHGIRSRPPSPEYRENYDKVFKAHTEERKIPVSRVIIEKGGEWTVIVKPLRVSLDMVPEELREICKTLGWYAVEFQDGRQFDVENGYRESNATGPD